MTLGNFNRYLPPKARIIAGNQPLIWESSQYAWHVAPASTASSSILTLSLLRTLLTPSSTNFDEIEIYRKKSRFSSLRSIQKNPNQSILLLTSSSRACFRLTRSRFVRVLRSKVTYRHRLESVLEFSLHAMFCQPFSKIFQKKVIWDMGATLENAGMRRNLLATRENAGKRR